MHRVIFGLAILVGVGCANSPAMAQTGYYRNDYFGSGYAGINDFLGSTSFSDPATQGPYPYFGYGRPLYYTGYGGYFPGPANYQNYGIGQTYGNGQTYGYGVGYNSGYAAPACGGVLPPSIMTP